MKITNSQQHKYQLRTEKQPTVDQSIEIQTSATYLTISQESLALYAKYLEQTTKVVQLQMQVTYQS